ncbi:hypothetical protein [Bradyrhizobium sp. B117]|uniref:DUF6895 family protein n=1 Tax=Bradyrhizobium sp. B117 TaxID=3140246 RepID=UPI00318331F5
MTVSLQNSLLPGNGPIEAGHCLPHAEVRAIAAIAEAFDESAAVLARALVVEDYDLAAEALMAWPLLSSPWSPAAAFGFRVVASLEDKVGFLPEGRLGGEPASAPERSRENQVRARDVPHARLPRRAKQSPMRYDLLT